jgi:hypothetical protein
MLIELFVETDFFEKPPTRDEGNAISNKDAGVEASKKHMSIFP